MLKLLKFIRIASGLLSISFVPRACGFNVEMYTAAERGGQKIFMVLFFLLWLSFHLTIVIIRRRQLQSRTTSSAVDQSL
jgi:hypothetical protein